MVCSATKVYFWDLLLELVISFLTRSLSPAIGFRLWRRPLIQSMAYASAAVPLSGRLRHGVFVFLCVHRSFFLRFRVRRMGWIPRWFLEVVLNQLPVGQES